MKKRKMLLFLAVLCISISIFKPIKVSALDELSSDVNVSLNADSFKEDLLEEQEKQEETSSDESQVLPSNGDTVNIDTEDPKEVESEDKQEETNNLEETKEDIHGGIIYDIQKVKVIVTKVDEEGNNLEGAKLQIIDSSNTIVDEWVSNKEAHEIELPDGDYTLHEVEAPVGYDLAEDKTFTIKVEIKEIDAGADFSEVPCPHYGGTPLYYVEIEGKKNEVYCINQNWETPDEYSIYDGNILNSGSIRDYTKQTIPVDLEDSDVAKVILSSEPQDVSDKTLSDKELYDKILDIIYHRHIANDVLENKYTEEELRFITEVALKNYTNPGITERQYNVKATPELIKALNDANVVYKTYSNTTTREYDEYVEGGKYYISYLKHNYRDYVYVPNEDDVYKVETRYGEGNSFSQMVAGHWASAHGANKDTEEAKALRKDVLRWYNLFEFLISNDNPHPDDMNLYIYSSNSTPQDLSGNDNEPGGKYQNLLGVTGYFEEVKQQEQEIEMVNKYSTLKTSVTVKKVWDDENNESKKRPEEVTITLLANGKEYEKVTITENDNWEHQFTDLPKFDNGEEITYTVVEEDIPEGYEVAYEETEEGFIVHNMIGQGDGEPDKPIYINPQTGDNILLYLITLIISLVGLLGGNLYLKKYAK